MANKKQRAVVICPGRGTYNKEELGYLKRYHSDKVDFIDAIDDYRVQQQQIKISELDAKTAYSMRLHTAGENASALIYACAISDYQDIDSNTYEVVAVTGNSMGWYIALAVAEALQPEPAITLINTMGSMMAGGVIGGQLIYPITNEYWQKNNGLIAQIRHWLAQVNEHKDQQVYISIELGGYIVFGGNDEGLKALEALLPVLQERYPMRLFNHAAFHTPLMNEVSNKAQTMLAPALFTPPKIPLIDGLGQVWQPYSCDTKALYDYTLTTQVTEPYNFTKAVEVAIKEFSPDKLIILGPGVTLGGAVAQTLIEQQWLALDCKESFISMQKRDPFVLAMGIDNQREQVTSKR